jgi:predicted HTH transcriptional regulator
MELGKVVLGTQITGGADGGSSEVRNPTLVRLLRQAGFAEQAGSGIPKIVRTWRGARRLPPTIENDPGRKVFRLTLEWELLASKRDDLWYRRLGVEISEDAGRLLTFARTAGAFDLTTARLVTGLSGRASVTLVSQLVTQQFVEVDETDEETDYKRAPPLDGVDRYLSLLRKKERIEHRGARRSGGYFPRSTKRD